MRSFSGLHFIIYELSESNDSGYKKFNAPILFCIWILSLNLLIISSERIVKYILTRCANLYQIFNLMLSSLASSNSPYF